MGVPGSSCGRFSVFEKVLGSDHLNRTWRLRDDSSRNRPEDDAPHTAVPVRSQHDQVSTPALCFFHNRVLRDALDDFRGDSDGGIGIANQIGSGFDQSRRVPSSVEGLLHVGGRGDENRVEQQRY